MDTPELIRKWKESEPIRLYVYGLVGPGIAIAIAYGVVSHERAAGLVALLTAVLVPGVELARSKATSPATLKRLTVRHRR